MTDDRGADAPERDGWINAIRDEPDTDQTEEMSADPSSDNWRDEIRDTPSKHQGASAPRQKESTHQSQSDVVEETSRPTIVINRYECSQCGALSSPGFHDDSTCNAPIIYSAGQWRCADCGASTEIQQTCFDCGASINNPRTKVPLDLSLRADPSVIEQAIHAATNRRRSDHGLETLAYSPHLSAVALQHSRDMARRDFFDHESPDGDGPADRYREFGHDARVSGENIALTYHPLNDSPEEVGRSVVDDWMDSQGHRENILRTQFDAEGIGVFIDSDSAVYSTQNFS